MKIKDCFLDEEKLSGGVRMPLAGFDDKPNGQWIDLLYSLSDRGQKAMQDAMRSDHEAGKLKPEDGKDNFQLLRRYTFALVVDWSFEDECTPENARLLFERNPGLAAIAASRAENQRFFLPDKKPSLSTGRKKSSK